MTNNTLTKEEIALAQHCLAFAQKEGAQQVRITLSKTLMNLIGVLNGEVDKTAHALDRSLQLQLFVDGKFGTFSSNRMEQDGLEAFIRDAIGTVRMLQADACRTLPAPDRLEKAPPKATSWACTTAPTKGYRPMTGAPWPSAPWPGPRKASLPRKENTQTLSSIPLP